MKVAAVVAANAELLVKLEAMAKFPSEACACGKTTTHERCRKCGFCEPKHGKEVAIWSNYRVVGANIGCGECEAKANMYSSPIYEWAPRPTFAAKIGSEFAVKIHKGYTLSEKQIAMAERLFAEGSQPAKPTTTERPALTWLSVASPAFKPVYTLVARDSFSFFTMLSDNKIKWSNKDTLEKEDIGTIREMARDLIEERTGYEKLTTPAEYADAGKAASGDNVLANAIQALFETHCWLLREKRVTEPMKEAA